MRPEGVSCSTCAWWEPKPEYVASNSGLCNWVQWFEVTQGDDWCAHWAHGRIEVDAGRLVVREVPVNEKPRFDDERK